MLDVARLRVLLAVAREGSVTGAARALHYTQPSVSHHLARLEAETGAVLTQRAGRGIRLTEAGRLLAERAEEILGRLDAAEAELAAQIGLRSGRVRLAAFPSALATVVPPAAARIAAAHPGVELSLVEAEPPEAVELLRAGEAEIAVLFEHRSAPAADLRALELLDEPMYLVRPADWSGDELAEFADRRWIAGCERCRTHLVEQCAAAGFSPEIAFTTDDYVAVQALVAAGLGVTTLPGLALRGMRHAEVVVTPLPEQSRRVYAATYGSPPDPPATAAVLAALSEASAALS